jgi:hypothetical protein
MREYKLTALMAATSFLLCSGLMTNNRQMYWMASVLGALMLGAYLLVRRGALQTTVQRHCPTELMEGETVDAQSPSPPAHAGGCCGSKRKRPPRQGLPSSRCRPSRTAPSQA